MKTSITTLNLLKLTYRIVLFTIVFMSCSTKTNKLSLNERMYCPNEISLFSIPDSMQVIGIDYSLSNDSIVQTVQNHFDDDICNEEVSFGLQYIYPIKVKVLKECFDYTVCFKRRSNVNISLNKMGFLRLNSTPMPIDSVKTWMKFNYPNKEMYSIEEVSIKWNKKVSKDSLKKVFVNIIDGYLLNYEVLSQELYSKSICELSSSQIDSLKFELPFNLKLNIGRRIVSPPPIIEEVIDIIDVKSNH